MDVQPKTLSRFVGALLFAAALSACGLVTPTDVVRLTVTVAGDGVGTVTSVPAGIDVTSGAAPSTLTVERGTEVTLSAVAADGSIFLGWTGACEGLDDCVLDMDDNRAVTATFTLDEGPAEEIQTLTVSVDGDGVGTVTSVPVGIEVTSGDDPATLDVPRGTEVTLTAAAAEGSTFAGWTGACDGLDDCVLDMDEDQAVTATFARIIERRTLTVTAEGPGEGSVTSVPAGISVTPGDEPDTLIVNRGAQVVLTATAAVGSSFVEWSGACVGVVGNECTVEMEFDAEVGARFDPALQNLTVNVVAGGTSAGSVTSSPAGIDTGAGFDSADFAEDSVVTLTAVVTSGAFAGWVGGDCDGIVTPVCDVVMDAAKQTTATFNEVETQVVRVGAGGDDASEFLGDSLAGQTFVPPQWFQGWVWATWDSLYLGWAPFHNLTETGLRFPGVAVPPGAIVTSAVLQVTAAPPEIDDTVVPPRVYPTTGAMALTIEGQLALNPAGFVQPPAVDVTFDITDRPRTQASVVWGITEDWAEGEVRQAPNVATILQELVNQPAWAAGNAVVLLLKDPNLDPASEIYRNIYSFESGAPVTRHPTLTVQYVVTPPVP